MNSSQNSQEEQQVKIQDVRQTIKLNKQMIQNLTKQLKQFEQQVIQLETQNSQYSSQDQIKTNDLQKLSQKCLNYEQQLGGLYNEQKVHVLQLQDQQDQINFLQNQLTHYQEQQKVEESQFEQVKSQNDNMQKTISEQQHKIIDLSESLQKYKNDWLKISEQNKQMQNQNDTILKQAQLAQQLEFDASVSQYIQTIQVLQSKNQLQAADNRLKDSSIQDLQEKLTDMSSKGQQFYQELQNKQQFIDKQQQQISQLSENLKQSQQEANNYNTDQAFSQQQIQILKAQNNELVDKLEKQMKYAKNELQQELITKNNKINSVTLANNELQQQNQAIKDQLQEFEITKLNLQQQVSELKNDQQNNQLKFQNEQLTKENAKLLEKLNQTKSNHNQLKIEYNQLINEVHGINENIQEEYLILQNNDMNHDSIHDSKPKQISNNNSIEKHNKDIQIQNDISPTIQSIQLNDQLTALERQVSDLKLQNLNQASELDLLKSQNSSLKDSATQQIIFNSENNLQNSQNLSDNILFLDSDTYQIFPTKQQIFNIFSSFSPKEQQQFAAALKPSEIKNFCETIFGNLENLAQDWNLQTEILTKQKLVLFFTGKKVDIQRKKMMKLYESDLADDGFVVWLMGVLFFILSQGVVREENQCFVYEIQCVKVMVIEK